jgi:hypothetical protein
MMATAYGPVMGHWGRRFIVAVILFLNVSDHERRNPISGFAMTRI